MVYSAVSHKDLWVTGTPDTNVTPPICPVPCDFFCSSGLYLEMIQEKKDEKDVSLKRLQTGVDKIDEAELDIAGHSWTNAGTNSQVQVGSKESQVQGGSLSMESESQFLLWDVPSYQFLLLYQVFRKHVSTVEGSETNPFLDTKEQHTRNEAERPKASNIL